MNLNRQGNSYIWIAVVVGIIIVIGAYMYSSSQSNTVVIDESSEVIENTTSTEGDAMMEKGSSTGDVMIKDGVEAQ